MIRLGFPTITAPTILVQLPDVEQLPRSRPVRVRQSVMESDAGAIIVYEIGKTAITIFTVDLYPLSTTHAQAIKQFFQSANPAVGVNGRANTFEFQDSTGSPLTVRFAQDVLEPKQITPNSWSVSLTLREEIL